MVVQEEAKESMNQYVIALIYRTLSFIILRKLNEKSKNKRYELMPQ